MRLGCPEGLSTRGRPGKGACSRRRHRIQIFGDFLRFSPHCHILITDGCFYGDKGMFRVAPALELKKLETIFQYKIFIMLLEKPVKNPQTRSLIDSLKYLATVPAENA